MRKRRVVILGGTGSIGESAAQVARDLPEQFEIVGISANRNSEKLAALAAEFHPKAVCITDPAQAHELRAQLPAGTRALSGDEGLLELASLPEADLVLVAIVGSAGLEPAMAAVEAGKDLAVASKEILVMAGELVMQRARERGVQVLPVDSEHNAIFQCLDGRPLDEVGRLILTCSGGPFRSTAASEFARATPEQALRHPTWDMGAKITIDSATLFNKALEMIEACRLFGVGMDRVDIIIHPQSIVHSMVEFVDGSILAQLSRNDMRFAIQYAVTWPDRVPGGVPHLDLAQIARLEFEAPRLDDFPAPNLARQAMRQGGTAPAAFNAANEVAVAAFLDEQIAFPTIWETVGAVLEEWPQEKATSIEVIRAADGRARLLAKEILQAAERE